jgi:hypothetical protein
MMHPMDDSADFDAVDPAPVERAQSVGAPLSRGELAAITATVAAAGGLRSAWLLTTLLAALKHPAPVSGTRAFSARTSVATTNVSPGAKADMTAYAGAAGVTLGAWVREQALAACPTYVAPAALAVAPAGTRASRRPWIPGPGPVAGRSVAPVRNPSDGS